MKNIFRKISSRASHTAGSANTFVFAVILVIMWALSGPALNFSNTWQLMINTCTTIVTFLMVFLIQNTQNRDSKAVQLKLDELIRSTRNARDSFMGLEELTDEDLAAIDEEFRQLSAIKGDQTSASLKKLQTKIEAEHKRRLSLKAAGQMLTSFGNMLTLNTLNANKNEKQIKPKQPTDKKQA